MKTNKMMRIASVLLVAVLLTTCSISGTFAKYVSQATGTDTARVAYWGWGGDSALIIDGLFAEGEAYVEADDASEWLFEDGTSLLLSNMVVFVYDYWINIQVNPPKQ